MGARGGGGTFEIGKKKAEDTPARFAVGKKDF